MIVTHNKIEITYNEADNQWEFTLRNREHCTQSLREARALIDRPVVEKRDWAFIPIKGWVIDWSGAKVEEGTATSAAIPKYGRTRLRVTINGTSRTVDSSNFFPLNEENAQLIYQLQELQNLIETTIKERDRVKTLLKGRIE